MTRWVPLLAIGCGNVPLEPGFEEDISQGWVCEGWGQLGPPATGADVLPVFYTGLDDGETFRVQVSLRAREATFVEAVDETFADYFFVYTGDSLIVDESENKCDDVIVGGGQRLDYLYRAVEGTARVVDDGDARGIEVEGIVLRADNTLLGELAPANDDWEDLPDVPLEDGGLPSFEATGS